jgi:hypothetical protein
MNTTKTIQSALISVIFKEGLEPIVKNYILKMLFYILQEGRFYKKI